ncbi:MAG TPA: hypothetical protein ENN65_04955, partial [Candidatus Hydrogenedentes bacterium]|nr:hypothetical protein [Candidatus Hydrogenedentota bacterium]
MTRICSVLAIMAFCGPADAEVGAVLNGVAVDGAAAAPQSRPAPAAKAAPKIDCDIFIDFDDLTAPCEFGLTTRITDAYAHLGVHFAGPGGNDGGAVLDECVGFGVTGHSSPNFLAFNTGLVMSDGGVPQGPETIYFDDPISQFSAKFGGSAAGNVTVTAYDYDWDVVDSNTAPVLPDLVEITVAGGGIQAVVISFTSPYLVVDDICVFRTEASGVLLMLSQCGGSPEYITPALANMGLANVTTVSNILTLSALLDLPGWDLVVVDGYNFGVLTGELDKLQAYYDDGGRVILFAWNLFSANAAHPLWAHLGMSVLSDYTTPLPVYNWSASNLFFMPNDVPDLITFIDTCPRDGQKLDVTTGLAHAGYTGGPAAGEVAIASDPDMRFIVNAFAPQLVNQDADTDGKHDMVELYENQIAHVLRGSGVLLLVETCGGSADFATPALENLGLPYTRTDSQTVFQWQLQMGDWDLVIV